MTPITVLSMSGNHIQLDLHADATISDVKDEICNHWFISPLCQDLMLGTARLEVEDNSRFFDSAAIVDSRVSLTVVTSLERASSYLLCGNEEQQQAALAAIASVRTKDEEVVTQAVLHGHPSKWPSVRAESIKVLALVAEKPSNELISVVGACLNDTIEFVREAAIQALVSFARRGKQQDVMEIVFDQLSVGTGRENFWLREHWCLPELLPGERTSGWSHTPRDARLVALKAIASVRSDLDISGIIKLSSHQRVEFRLYALEALCVLVQRTDNDVVTAMARCATDADESVRRKALEVLAAMDTECNALLIATVCKYLRDPLWDIRQMAVQTLSEVANEGDPYVLKAARHNLRWWNAAQVATIALGTFGSLQCHGRP